ncbi:cytochrome c-type biogenesis protein [Sphingomicrobium sp. XHP0239]|uniref:cytochrome c-type biogenesis protein n=1 Tax=Sphingomicrobium maritimum TaxID=3133972 RepID=UPI0031CC77D0
MMFAALFLAAATSAAPADYADRQLDDPALEAEAVQLMEELRCLTCEGQSIAESDADMAGDMRHLVRARLAKGERPAEVRGWLVDRYGSVVTYRPVSGDPVSWPLFAAPLVLLALAAWLLRRRFVRRSKGE